MTTKSSQWADAYLGLKDGVAVATRSPHHLVLGETEEVDEDRAEKDAKLMLEAHSHVAKAV